MNEALSDLFVAAKSAEIEWGGERAYAIYEIAPAPVEIIIEFLKAKSAPVQGLTLKINGGVLEVNGTAAPEIILWSDTASDRVSLRLKREAGEKAVLKLWNVWRGSMGGVDVTHAWLGNAGMRIDRIKDGRELLLHCSDGEGAVDFSDLELRVLLID